MDRNSAKLSPRRLAALSAAALVLWAALSAAAPVLAEDGGGNDDVDVTGSASYVESPTATPEPTLSPTPEPTLPPGVSATPKPTPTPAPARSGWPAANWAVVGIYGLVVASSLPLLFRRRRG